MSQDNLVQSASFSVKGNDEGQRVAIVTLNGKMHTHLIKPSGVICEECIAHPKIWMMLQLTVSRSKSGL